MGRGPWEGCERSWAHPFCATGPQTEVRESRRAVQDLSDGRQLGILGVEEVEVLEAAPHWRCTNQGQQASTGELPDVVADRGQWLLQPDAGLLGTARLIRSTDESQDPLPQRVAQSLLNLVGRAAVLHVVLLRGLCNLGVRRWSYTQMSVYWWRSIDLSEKIITRVRSTDNQLLKRHDLRVSDENAGVARSFGDRLASLRVKKGLSQEQLAERAGIHRTAVSNLEAAKHVCRLDTAIRLAGALEIDLCELLAGLPSWSPPATSGGGFSS